MAKGHGLGDYITLSVLASVLPYICASVHLRPCISSSRFYINLNISFICQEILTKFTGNVYGCDNLSVQNFGLILKNKMATIGNCLKSLTHV